MKQTIYLADHYFTGEVLTWELDRPSHSRQGSHVADCPFGWGWPLQSTSLVCPSCNKVWARLAVEGQHRHHFTPAVCSTFCADLDEQFIPGSLLSNLWLPEGIDWDLYPLLPRILQEREARLALEYIELPRKDMSRTLCRLR
jgi:hypothetical protein